MKNEMQKIYKSKSFSGVPGVKMERFKEGLEPKHCALSLVGEPIMYPEINNLIRLMHSRRISTFLVTNAQFPDAIRHLKPVTQLYVSVDASNKDSLKKIDRPLFRDFWERYIDSLKALSEKVKKNDGKRRFQKSSDNCFHLFQGQRTVYRLTLVKSFNVEEIENYAKLVELGKPDFIEIKVYRKTISKVFCVKFAFTGCHLLRRFKGRTDDGKRALA